MFLISINIKETQGCMPAGMRRRFFHGTFFHVLITVMYYEWTVQRALEIKLKGFRIME